MVHSANLRKHPTHETVPGYWRRHEAALRGDGPHGSLEHAMASMLAGWADYADAHRAAYASGIGEDGVLGREWEAIGQALLGLLNGDLGRLDGGAIDHAIRGSLAAEGFEPA